MLTLYGHPFSSYTQKVLIALYENELLFTQRVVGSPDDPAAAEEHRALWPVAQFPVLVDDGRTVAESSIIIEYLHLYRRGAVQMIPDNPDAALEVRFMDRFFDNHVMTPVQSAVLAAIRDDETRKAEARARSAERLDIAYAWLEQKLVDRTWAAGSHFSMADCAAAPSLFYADWTHEIGEQYPALRGYRSRLLARPSFARAVDEARPFRSYFPLGAPERD